MKLPGGTSRLVPAALLSALLAGLPVTPSHAASSITLHERIDLDADRLAIERRDTGDLVFLKGSVPVPPAAATAEGARAAGRNAGAGEGEFLPEVAVTLRLPDGTTPGRITVTVIAADTLPAELRPAAALPAAPARAGYTGRLRGRTLGSVLVTPFSRDAATGRLLFFRRMEIAVELVADSAAEPRFTPARAEPWADATLGAAADRLTGNVRSPDRATRVPVRPLASGGQPFHPTFRPSLDGTPVEYLIITDTAQESVYQELADWKTRSGTPAVVRTVDWIRANYPQGVDLQETIRGFIRDAATRWGTLYVLLGGDAPVIPMRFARTTFFQGADIPTDLYYQCLDGTWNADGDAFFGEGSSGAGPGDQADLYADVYLGRLPTNNAAEAQVLVDKILAYARTPPRDGSLTRLLAMGEVLFPSAYTPGATIVLDGADLCESALSFLPPAWDPVRLYEHCPAPAFPSCILEEKGTVIDSINAGFGILHHVGHGYINTMSVGAGGLTLNNADAAGLTNAGSASVLYAINCTSSAIDFSCIAERFLLNPAGGAVASIGSTREDFPLTSWDYQNEFYRLLFQQGWTELGWALDGSRLPFIGTSGSDGPHRWMQMTPILLGDPAMRVWTAEPGDLAVSVPPAFPLGGGPVPVGVTSGGSPVPGALVCIDKAGDDYVTAWTDSSGLALVSFAPDTLGAYTVTVTALNHIPFIGSGSVTPASAPHLFVSGTLCDDDTTVAPGGNGDGRIDAGETVALRFTLRNRGGATGDSATATLSSGSPHLAILDAESRYPVLGPGGEEEPLDPIVIRIDRATPDRTEIHAHLSIDDGTAVFGEDIVLRVHAPILEWYRMTARDSTGTGNGNGILEPGEPFVLRPVLRNRGLGPSDGLIATLSSADPVFTITDSLIDFGTVAGEMALSGPPDGFEVAMSDTAGLAAGGHALRVTLTDTRSAGAPVGTFVITPPGAPAAPANLTATGRPGAVELRFDPSTHPRLRGYTILRSASPAGPFVRINPDVTERTAYYRDEGLTPFVFFHYRVTAQDSSGNESPPSAVAGASTSLPLRAGFPITTGASGNGSVTLANLDQDPQLEILGAGREIYAVNGDGSEVHDGDGNGATIGALTNSGGPSFWNAPAVGDADLDGFPDIAAVSWTGSLYLWSAEGVVKPGFPKNLNVQGLATPNPLGSVAMADVDGDGTLELFCSVGAVLFAFHPDGTELLDGDNNPATTGVFKVTSTPTSYGTPALRDLNGDGRPEIIAGMRDGRVHVFEATTSAVELPGFPVVTGGSITASPAVGDLDNDGSPDIVVGSSSGNMFALKADGTPVPGWPKSIALLQDLDSSPALGDLTGDGIPDVVCGASNGRVHAWRNDGTILPGFPVLILDSQGAAVPLRSSPCLVDIDGDGTPEILIGDQIGRLHGIRADGAPLPGFPVRADNAIEGAPAAWDLDGDGLTEIVAQAFDQKIYAWDTPWTFGAAASPWPMFHHDARHTGDLGGPSPTSGAGGEESSPAQRPVERLTGSPNPFRDRTRIHFTVAGSRAETAGAATRPVTVDIFATTGRRVRALLSGPLPSGAYSVTWDGRDDGGRTLPSGVYHCRVLCGGELQRGKLILDRR